MRPGLRECLVSALSLLVACATTREVFVATPRAANTDDPLACEDPECSFRVAAALGLRYQAIDADGNPVGEPVQLSEPLMFAAGGVPMQVPLAAEQIRIEARCQPELRVPGDEQRVEPSFGPPERRTAWLRGGSTLRPLFFEGDAHSFPENTVVEVFRPWPDESGTCNSTAVRIANLGGVALEGMTYEESFEFIRGRYFTVLTSQVVERETDGPSLAEQARLQREERERAQEFEAVADEGAAAEEMGSNRCTDARRGMIERVLGAVHRRVSELDTPWRRMHREVLVIGRGGTAVPYRPLDDGEHAAIVVSFDTPGIGVRRGRTDMPPADSSLARLAESRDTAVATTGFAAQTGHDYELRLTGRGCAGVLLYRRER
jgi:hypothetical protein